MKQLLCVNGNEHVKKDAKYMYHAYNNRLKKWMEDQIVTW